jgi:putative transposase
MFHQTLLENGQKMVLLDVSGQKKEQEKDFIGSPMSTECLEQKILMGKVGYQYVMQEFLQITKKKTLIDKLNYLKSLFQGSKLSKISDQESIMNEKDFLKFSKEFLIMRSTKSMLPIRTDYVDLDPKLLNGSLKSLTSNSSFLTLFQVHKNHKEMKLLNLLKIFYQLQQSLLQGIMELGQQDTGSKGKKRKRRKKNKVKAHKEQKINSAIRLRIYPNKAQKETYKKWFGVSRFLYNKSLEFLEGDKEVQKTITVLRTQFINEGSKFFQDHKFLNDIPYDVKDEALRDLLKNYKSNFAKGKHFKLKFRSRKFSTESFNVLSKHWSHKKGHYAGMFNLRCEKSLPDKLDHTSRIILTKKGEYYICMPRTKNIKKSPRTEGFEGSKTVSIDPGIRTFLTCYDPEGLVMKIGEDSSEYIGKFISYKRKIISKMDRICPGKGKGRLKRSLKKVRRRIENRIQNVIGTFHKKIANFLCTNYNTIVIPKLNFHKFKNMNRRIKSKFIILSHCKFVDRLIMKSKMYSNCNVKVITEEYTSKTCSCCGFIKNDLGPKKIFKCDKCHKELCRDTNGAFNIYKKYLRESSVLL